jgi:hypothetical protein
MLFYDQDLDSFNFQYPDLTPLNIFRSNIRGSLVHPKGGNTIVQVEQRN